jgi:hypothetical protein
VKTEILILSLLCITLVCGAQNRVPGTVVTAPVVPNDTRDDIATHIDTLGYGGARSVPTIAARDAIKTSRRSDGMLVFVRSTRQWFQLGAGLTNAEWTLFSGSGTAPAAASAIVDVAVRSDTVEHHLYPMVRAGARIYFAKSFPDSLYYINVSCFNRFGTVPYVITSKKPDYFAVRPVETCTCTYDAKQINK